MSLPIRTLQLVINSRDRIDYNSTTSTDFRVSLLNPLNFDILEYALESCCIPKTSYNIGSNNNSLAFTGSVGIANVILTPGNYTITTLLAALQTAFNIESPDTYVFSLVDGKVTITSAFAGFVLNPDPAPYELLLNLGFNPEQVYTSTLGNLSAPYLPDISGIKNIFIKIEQLSEYMRDTKNLSSNFKVDYGCPFGSILYFGNQNKYEQYYRTAQNHMRKTQHFDVKLVDESGNIVDLNGSNWSFVLRFIVRDLY